MCFCFLVVVIIVVFVVESLLVIPTTDTVILVFLLEFLLRSVLFVVPNAFSSSSFTWTTERDETMSEREEDENPVRRR